MDWLDWAAVLIFIVAPICLSWNEANKRLKNEINDLRREIEAKDRIIQRLQNPES